MHTTPTTEAEDEILPGEDSDRAFHDGDDDEVDALPGMTSLRVKVGHVEVAVSAEGPEGPGIVADLMKLALDAASKLQSSVQ
jgi:hypothetical protein